MKKMWKLNNKAVSPVIATILMVAITVVLAAVLYVMVMGFGDGGADETPTGSLTVTKNGTLNYTITLASISESGILDADVVVTYSPAVASGPTSLTNVVAGGAVQAGDYVTVVFPVAGTYIVSLLYTETDNNIASITINAS